MMAARVCEPLFPLVDMSRNSSALGLFAGIPLRVRYPIASTPVFARSFVPERGLNFRSAGRNKKAWSSSCQGGPENVIHAHYSHQNSCLGFTVTKRFGGPASNLKMGISPMPLGFEIPNLQLSTCGSSYFLTRSTKEDLSNAETADIFREQKRADDGVICLVIGAGGREHSLCYALRRSATCAGVFCAPGNAGISSSVDATCVSNLDITDSLAVASFCKEWGVGLVVVGPEGPLISGLVDDLMEAGIPTFGPSAEAATLEGSKTFMKRLCDKYQIPTAKYSSFTDAEEAKKYIKEQELPIVVKADGLAAGKGVIIADTLEEAFDAVDAMLVDGAFGSAGGLVVVEEFLDGEEVSFFAIVDGETALPLASAQDHKRVGDGDVGLNTGGMGAYSPAPVLTPELETLVMDSIILPTVKGMKAEGCRFVGVLYAGVIVETKSGLPKLLEYNVRFGDPECQVLMLRLQSDLVQVLLAACQGQLKGIHLKWADEPALVIVMASNGYPGDYKKGTVIKNLEEAENYGSNVKLFHAGTALDSQENVVAVGGRVLGVTAMGKDIVEAQKQAYQVVDCINWPQGFCRRDIGWRAVARHNASLPQEMKEQAV